MEVRTCTCIFKIIFFRKQKAVIRGQGYNLVESLRQSSTQGLSGSPYGLLQRPVVAVYDEDIYMDEFDGTDGSAGIAGGDFMNRQKRKLRIVSQRFETFTRSRPCFSWC